MPTSAQVTSAISFAITGFVITGVAVMMSRAIAPPRQALLAQTVKQPLTPEKVRDSLVEKYGVWAVNMAEGFCPYKDVTCWEREAKRFYEVFTRRRL